MGNLFLRSINIKNYKCFENTTIEFNEPNGKLGSGLNLLIGENGSGKTSILEAVNYLSLGKYVSENKLNVNDFQDINKEIKITGKTNSFSCRSSIDFYNKYYFKSDGIEFIAEPRKSKERGKLLSSPFEIKNWFSIQDGHYYQDSSKKKEIDSRDKYFDNNRLNNDEFNVFYFDKNRSRHLLSGTYKTTFDKICEDLNWKFLKSINEDNLEKMRKNILGEYFKNVIELSQKGIGEKLAKELSEFFNSEKQYKKLKIELLNLLHPFSNAFFALRDDESLKQVSINNLGSGIEIILTLLFLKTISNESKGTLIYLIDEPELHLHPRAQDSLSKLLLEEAKDKQIIISTHSPYLFKNLLNQSGVLILSKNSNGKIEISKEDRQSRKLLPWSPSWGEVNYKAFSMSTVEFHNELYGYIESVLFEQNKDETNFDDYLECKRLEKNKNWIKIKKDGTQDNPKIVTLQTYIRHFIHHPENLFNKAYTEDEFKQSIKEMISLINKETNNDR